MRRVVVLLLMLFASQLDAAELDKELADFKRDVLEVNKRLLLLEEELLFPADTQVVTLSGWMWAITSSRTV